MLRPTSSSQDTEINLDGLIEAMEFEEEAEGFGIARRTAEYGEETDTDGTYEEVSDFDPKYSIFASGASKPAGKVLGKRSR